MPTNKLCSNRKEPKRYPKGKGTGREITVDRKRPHVRPRERQREATGWRQREATGGNRGQLPRTDQTVNMQRKAKGATETSSRERLWAGGMQPKSLTTLLVPLKLRLFWDLFVDPTRNKSKGYHMHQSDTISILSSASNSPSFVCFFNKLTKQGSHSPWT